MRLPKHAMSLKQIAQSKNDVCKNALAFIEEYTKQSLSIKMMVGEKNFPLFLFETYLLHYDLSARKAILKITCNFN